MRTGRVAPLLIRSTCVAEVSWRSVFFQGRLPRPGVGSWLCRHGRLLPDGAPEQRRLLLAPRHLRLLRCPLGSLHNAPTWEQTQVAPGLPEGGREPAAPASLPVPAWQRPPALALHAAPQVRVQPRQLFPPGFCHQEDVDERQFALQDRSSRCCSDAFGQCRSKERGTEGSFVVTSPSHFKYFFSKYLNHSVISFVESSSLPLMKNRLQLELRAPQSEGSAVFSPTYVSLFWLFLLMYADHAPLVVHLYMFLWHQCWLQLWFVCLFVWEMHFSWKGPFRFFLKWSSVGKMNN